MVLAVVGWGLFISVFGVTSNLVLAFVLLIAAGYTDVISSVLRGSMLQLSSPEDMRGRLSAIQIAVVTGGPRLGDIESGLVATLFTTTVSVVSGGMLCAIGALAVWRMLPGFSRFVARPHTRDGEIASGHT